MGERRPRYDGDPAERRDLAERLLAAASGGGIEQLLALLAPDARLVSDGGGRAKAPRRIIETAGKVGRFLLAAAQDLGPGVETRIVEINGGPAAAFLIGGELDTVCLVDVSEGAIQCAYITRNPDKTPRCPSNSRKRHRTPGAPAPRVRREPGRSPVIGRVAGLCAARASPHRERRVNAPRQSSVSFRYGIRIGLDQGGVPP